MNVEIQPYFAEGERYPTLIGVRVEGDEYETAYVSKGELVDALADNAKLRELLADLSVCACGKYCYGCPHQYDGCDRDKRLRELGVEVE